MTGPPTEAARSTSRRIARPLELAGERTAMIPISKSAAILSVILCGALTVSMGAQEADEARPRPGPRREWSARPAPMPSPDERADELPPPARPASPEMPRARFIGPPRLSEEAMRSSGEKPRTADGPVPEEGVNPFEDAQPPPAPAAPPRSARTAPPPHSTTARIQQRPEYVVEPPDLILVEVLEALP